MTISIKQIRKLQVSWSRSRGLIQGPCLQLLVCVPDVFMDDGT